MRPTPVFSLTGSLPRGHVAIEASAAPARPMRSRASWHAYVAEADLSIDKLLMVTSHDRGSRAARPLRSPARRGRGRPHRGRRAVRRAARTALAATDHGPRLQRLERALSEFDATTITTIHGFAQQVLSTLGSQAPGNLDVTLLEDTAELVDTVCADMLAAESVENPGVCDRLPAPGVLAKLAIEVLGNPGIRVVPGRATPTRCPRRHG